MGYHYIHFMVYPHNFIINVFTKIDNEIVSSSVFIIN
jgi:hypothetical protein